MNRVLLYFGSFNPVHKGHIRLAEYMLGQNLCDEVVLVVSPQNPFKQDLTMVNELQRFEMAEIACAESPQAAHIKVSAIEFLLDNPSYTINTLNYLSYNFGREMEFSILIGADNVQRFDEWRDYRLILDRYPLYVYPRKGYAVTKLLDRIHYLAAAPLFDYSSTDIRQAIERGESADAYLSAGVATYIREHNLWSPADYIVRLTAELDNEPDNTELRIERSRWYYRRNEWGNALNDLSEVLRRQPDHTEAKAMQQMIEEILAFRYKDIYNP